ncbi:MAG: electron transfer flavoprotein subunit alpha/FixB family protein [Candidatus Rokubacteria bacterium]|nr:electron transfer flavoprotein subunit alpha/FixB family protein [Candidatus Rokubacteria bacterium]
MIPPAYGPEAGSGLWVYLEQEGGGLESVAIELLGKGRELAVQKGTPLTGLLLGHDVAGAARRAIAHGADHVLLADDPLLASYTTDAYTNVVARIVLEGKPETLLLGATPNGRDLAGRLAVRLRTGLTADCTGLALEAGTGLLLGDVTGFGGGVMASIKCAIHRPQMATVRPGIFPPPTPDPTRAGAIERVPVELSPADIRTEILERVRYEGVDITRARVIVAGGRGVKGDFAPLAELARLLGGEVGASRVACDLAWIGRDRQIGQTGFVTRPKLAIVCGVSGATQFTVGIKGAECIVAINSDRDAPIFEEADLCVVDDLFPVVETVIAELRRERGL